MTGRHQPAGKASRHTQARVAYLLLAFGVVSIAACGNDPAPSDQATTTTTGVATAATSDSAAAATGRSPAQAADAACANYLEVIASNGPLPVVGFDPDNPRADQLPEVGAHFERAVEAAERQAQTLRPLADEQPTGSPLARYVEALDAENANSRAQVDAAVVGDVDAFTATLANVEALHAARVDAAVQLGSPHCAEG